MPEEITTLFATTATTFQPIAGQPTDEDLTALHDVLSPPLLDIPYNMDGMHNLIGLIEPTLSFTTTWGMAFPIPPRPPAYPAIADNASAVVRAVASSARRPSRVSDGASVPCASASAVCAASTSAVRRAAVSSSARALASLRA